MKSDPLSLCRNKRKIETEIRNRPRKAAVFPLLQIPTRKNRRHTHIERQEIGSTRLLPFDGIVVESSNGFKDKVALVVGGASGMGNAVVRLLTRAGSATHVFDVKETADGVFHHCDVRGYDEVRRSVQHVIEKEGRIDLLFIAAGVHLFANIEDTSIEELERVLSINLKGPFYVLKEVLPVMKQQRSGNVVLMGSDQVLIGKGSSAAYGMSKAALGQLTKSTAIDYAPYNIRVNCICPGTIDTPMLGPSIARFHELSGMPIEDIYRMLRTAQPIQRLGTADEIGSAVMFLLSDECSFMTGSLLSVDGGYTCQ